MPIRWIPVSKDTPEPGERVMVKNSCHCWDTEWRQAMADPGLPAPVLMWSREEVGTLKKRVSSVDPQSIEKQIRVKR